MAPDGVTKLYTHKVKGETLAGLAVRLRAEGLCVAVDFFRPTRSGDNLEGSRFVDEFDESLWAFCSGRGGMPSTKVRSKAVGVVGSE